MDGLDVRMRAVACRHGRVEVVSGVHLDIEAGERVALTGTNGSGKTTLVRAVLGLHRQDEGQILVGGRGTGTAAEWAWRRRACAWIPQKPAVGRFPLLGRELLASSGAPREAEEAAHKLGVGPLTGRPLHTLSGGQLQRMYLARAVGCVAAEAGVLPTPSCAEAGQDLGHECRFRWRRVPLLWVLRCRRRDGNGPAVVRQLGESVEGGGDVTDPGPVPGQAGRPARGHRCGNRRGRRPARRSCRWRSLIAQLAFVCCCARPGSGSGFCVKGIEHVLRFLSGSEMGGGRMGGCCPGSGV
jgi:ABC-type transport system involved in cytochrome c biogenesis ATPase subunit